MTKYRVGLELTIEDRFEVEAGSEDEAIKKAKGMARDKHAFVWDAETEVVFVKEMMDGGKA